jgi:F-type H+-transporting ATPase subunit b
MRVVSFTFIVCMLLALTIYGASAATDSKVPVQDSSIAAMEPSAGQDTGEASHTKEEHDEGGLPQLNFSTYASQAFWLLLMFVVLYTTFSKATLPAIGSVIDAREGKIKADLDAAEAMRVQAQAIQDAYEKGLEQARAQALFAIQDVELAAKQKAADKADAFRKKSETEILAAETRMDEVRLKAMGDMTAVAAEVAGLAAEKITGISTDTQKAKAIVETIAGKAKAA